jgi:hypothetical protein
MAAGACRLQAHQEDPAMIRLLLVGLFGYVTYRYARAFIRSVPDNFEPVGLLPPPKPVTTVRPKKTSAGRRARAR